MNYNVSVIPNFKKELKKLVKKYPSIKNDFSKLIEELEVNPKLGTSLGNNCYKIRMAITSKGKGKSGGSRIITYVQVSETSVYLLSIYDKSSKTNITDKELSELLEFIPK
ncbi:type II toxin-antitoxin system RelE/ParE family toxin [Flammeovirga sp. MY04]|uniref:type II toxin-antitoxin system RelE/ParE family toxin n=1 Tax=Flammeovirga sp. MY04 TaxID=1191459 RepID=UPI000806092E|nr:type II toxin-antitoxin system RelE/ParE family toxin [Flammeovirga sp. MY04]ANQ51520.1 type II toxin-antitoxin system RelE/ParE family toxin [Flammeovirga sp. MY04]